MTRVAKVELRDLQIAAAIGTYEAGAVIPDAHILDLTLTIAADLVQVSADNMALVFDYDPLIAQIDQIAREQKYETQEYLMTLMSVHAPITNKSPRLIFASGNNQCWRAQGHLVCG